jgi:thiol-disulfide isomerase/thioredoxin
VTGLWALLGALAAAALIAVLLRRREGRIRAARSAVRDAASGDALPDAVRALLHPDEGPAPVTLVQVTTTYCTACRPARAVLTELSTRTPGLRHVELDVTDTPEVAARLGVLRAPTTLAFDPRGTELLRVGGVPKTDALLDALRPHLPG